jgi:APA family basic amino acid/polyamine antiporter
MAQSAGGIPAKRALGPWMSRAPVVGNMIGSGVFLLPASLAAYGGTSIVACLFTTVGALEDAANIVAHSAGTIIRR